MLLQSRTVDNKKDPSINLPVPVPAAPPRNVLLVLVYGGL
jgi:hypothetical protein